MEKRENTVLTTISNLQLSYAKTNESKIDYIKSRISQQTEVII
jgi:hypothetical protein